MTKAEINARLQALLEQDEQISNATEQEVETLNLSYAELRKQSEDQQLQAFINGGGDSVEFSYTADEEDENYKNLKTTFDQRLKKQKAEKAQSKQNAFDEKRSIITELQAIAKTDVKNLGKNFQTANKLQDRWKALPHQSDDTSVQLENEYKHLLDTFYYDAKIVKDAIELDYQRNHVAKKKVIEKIVELSSETDARLLEQKIRQYEKEWYRVGPVKRDIRDESKQELENAVAGLQGHLDSLYENQQELLTENLGKKIALCERLNELLGKSYSSPKQQQQAADKVIALQNEWKEIGRSTENDRIWDVFRGACDSFFEQKRDFFKHLASNRKENKTNKQDLIEKAEKNQNSTDWKKTADYMIGLQKEWKKVGPAHPAEDQKLWEKFRGACDVFFNARKESFKDRDKEYIVNLEKKQTIISELEEFKPTGNVGKDMSELQKFEKEYQGIGYVPFKQKDKIHKAFYDKLNALYSSMNINKKEKDKMRYENRVKSMATGKKPDKTLNYEQNKLKQELSELNTKLSQYENNINIVSSGKENPLVKMVQKNMNDTKRQIEQKQMQLNLIRDAKQGNLNLGEEE